MMTENNKIPGRLTVSSKAARDLIKHITLNFDGVAALAAPAKKDELVHIIRGGLNEGGIYITKTKKGLAADIYILIRYGAEAKELRDALTAEIQSELKKYLHMTVSKITVHVRGAAVDGA